MEGFAMAGLVGLLPAAGLAKRLAPMPCSKEIFPVGLLESKTGDIVEYRPKPVGLYLIERMINAGVERVFVILNKEKWDILRYFGNGSSFGVPIAYLVQESISGMPDALNQAYPWIQMDTVLFGMPDTIFEPDDSLQILLSDHRSNNADVTLGLFPTKKPERFGMVSYDQNHFMKYTVDKPLCTELKYMWGIGCWGPVFSRFMMDKLKSAPSSHTEIVLGDVFQAALDEGLSVRVTLFEHGEYIDIGNLDDLTHVIQRFSRKS
jgi:glucose-1-phosphate thymidylyltransferase